MACRMTAIGEETGKKKVYTIINTMRSADFF